MTSSNKSIRCLQINLQHSRIALLSLYQSILDLDIDMVFIQEPYVIINSNSLITLPDIPNGYVVHHQLNNEAFFEAAILMKSCYTAQLISSQSNYFLVGIELNCGS